MMASARLKVDALVRDAGERIRAELIDTAAELAQEKLPELITQQDHEKLVRDWMNSFER